MSDEPPWDDEASGKMLLLLGLATYRAITNSVLLGHQAVRLTQNTYVHIEYPPRDDSYAAMAVVRDAFSDIPPEVIMERHPWLALMADYMRRTLPTPFEVIGDT